MTARGRDDGGMEAAAARARKSAVVARSQRTASAAATEDDEGGTEEVNEGQGARAMSGDEDVGDGVTFSGCNKENHLEEVSGMQRLQEGKGREGRGWRRERGGEG